MEWDKTLFFQNLKSDVSGLSAEKPSQPRRAGRSSDNSKSGQVRNTDQRSVAEAARLSAHFSPIKGNTLRSRDMQDVPKRTHRLSAHCYNDGRIDMAEDLAPDVLAE
jgi:hypothetical protein